MLKGIQFVVETNSEKERAELRDYIADKVLFASVTPGGEGRQLMAISTGDVWFLTIVSEEMLKPLTYKFFKSFTSFKKYCEETVWTKKN